MPCKLRLASCNSCTLLLHWAGLNFLMPRIPRNAYFLYNDPYHLAKEGCDKNRQTIAVTLRLRFAVRVNNGNHGVIGGHSTISISFTKYPVGSNTDFNDAGIVWTELGCVRLTFTKVSQTLSKLVLKRTYNINFHRQGHRPMEVHLQINLVVAKQLVPHHRLVLA